MNNKNFCKWLEQFGYDEENNPIYLCHIKMNAVKVDLKKNCSKCPHFEKCSKEE